MPSAVFGLLLPVAVKPEKVGMELRVELVELREIEIHEMLPTLRLLLDVVARESARLVGIVVTTPVEQRKI